MISIADNYETAPQISTHLRHDTHVNCCILTAAAQIICLDMISLEKTSKTNRVNSNSRTFRHNTNLALLRAVGEIVVSGAHVTIDAGLS